VNRSKRLYPSRRVPRDDKLYSRVADISTPPGFMQKHASGVSTLGGRPRISANSPVGVVEFLLGDGLGVMPGVVGTLHGLRSCGICSPPFEGSHGDDDRRDPIRYRRKDCPSTRDRQQLEPLLRCAHHRDPQPWV